MVKGMGSTAKRRPHVALPKTGPGSIKVALAPYEHLIIKGKEAISAAIPIVDGKVNYVGGWFGVAPMSCPAELGKPAVVEQFAAVLRGSQQITDTIIGPFNTAEEAAEAFDALAPFGLRQQRDTAPAELRRARSALATPDGAALHRRHVSPGVRAPMDREITEGRRKPKSAQTLR